MRRSGRLRKRAPCKGGVTWIGFCLSMRNPFLSMIASLSSSSVRYARLALLAVVLLVPVLSPVLRADILVDVYPTLAPNRFGSPSYNTWVTNTTTALQNGNSSGGTAGTPSFYQQIATGSTLPTTAIVVTDFPSWLGSANPVGTYGAAFGGELGNRLLFSLTLRGTAGTS